MRKLNFNFIHEYSYSSEKNKKLSNIFFLKQLKKQTDLITTHYLQD